MNQLKWISSIVFATLAAAAVGALPAGAQEDDTLRIQITKGTLNIPIAVPAFFAAGVGSEINEATAEITETVRNDLKVAGIFNLADSIVYTQIARHDESRIPFDRYNEFGLKALALGKVAPDPSGIRVEIRLFDVGARSSIVSKAVTGSLEQRRRIAHRIAGHILNSFLGDMGIFESKIIYASSRDAATGNTEIWLMDYDGFGQRRVTYSESLKLFPSIGPGDSGIVYTSFINNNADVYHLSLAGGLAKKVVASRAVDMAPAISPDGTKIAFSSSMRGNMEIYVSNIDGSGLTRLTSHRAIDSSPTWSPDGRRIAYTSSRTGLPQIYVMNADGSGQRRITYEGRYNDGAAWGPDGTMIAYSARRRDSKTFDIRIHELTTGQTYYVTRDIANDENPSWSSDGRLLAFSSDRSGAYQIYTITIDGRNMKQLTRVGENKHPSWSR